VRILATKIRDDPKHFAWVWTVMGERNWTTAKSSGYELALSGSYPVNSRDRVGGTNIWEASINVDAPARGGASYTMAAQLRGSNAAMMRSTVSIDAGANGELADAPRAVQTSETVLSLPAKLTLASVGRKNITLQIDP
jgi:hypothetical protein